ncbi:MAG: non-canonical purine NTP pyrophosphatase [Acidobacteriota bacterium]|nr:non-canonical purine NTP pyrophosphatase [Acidobacteriota bacterium]
MKILFATTNPNKVREVRHALRAAPPYEIVTLADVAPVPDEPEEIGTTYWENARIKALAYAQATGLTTIAEDSGFEVDALGGEPGVQSARFLDPTTSYPDRFAEIYRRLAADKPKGLSPQQPSGGDQPLGLSSSARFVTALAVARGDELLFETESAIEGIVARAPAGQHGFGYDPIFYYPPFGGTVAQLSDDHKTAVSHRARAFRDLHRWLRTRRTEAATNVVRHSTNL